MSEARGASAFHTLCNVSFWFGLWLALMGSLISFYPGAECAWFVTAAALMAPGALHGRKIYRAAVLIACLLSLLYAYAGYHRGVDYRKGQQKRGGSARASQVFDGSVIR